jgi:hypothetical protein
LMPRASQFLKAGSAKFKSRCVGWCKHMLEFIKQVVMDAHTHTHVHAHTHTHTHARTHACMHAQDMDLMAEEDGLIPKHASKGSSLTVMPLLS